MFAALRELFTFLLTQGLASILWVGGLAATGLTIGVFASFGLGFLIRRSKLGKRRPAAAGSLVLYTIIAFPICLSLVGSLVGSAYAVKELTQDPILVRRAVDLSFSGTSAALSSVDLPEEQRELVLDFVGGETSYAFGEIESVFDRVSDETLQRVLAVYDDQWSAQDRVLGVAARELGRRLVQELISSRARQGKDLVSPAIDELREADDGDGQATGPEIGLALVQQGIQRPLARWAFWAVMSQALILLPALAAVILGPVVLLWLYDRLRGPGEPAAA
ncbi:MAG: hypothetical protein AAGA81_03825 [Acidobacteriota bacterium]